MKRLTLAAVLAVGAFAATGAAAAPGPGSPASCAGYLASYANPNNGYIIHALEKPAAEAAGVPMGTLQNGYAQQHGESIDACIP
jgi:hypothetical protein